MALTSGQQACIQTLDRPLVVAAGAGSGKTFTLTQRIAYALESGALDDIGRVCAITFTNKAAGELKARIKAELRARGMTEQALKVDDAWISTIHGMCARILRAMRSSSTSIPRSRWRIQPSQTCCATGRSTRCWSSPG